MTQKRIIQKQTKWRNKRTQAIAIIIVAFIETIGLIINACINKKTNKKVDLLTELKAEIKAEIEQHILESDKTFLTDFLSEVENGIEKSDIQLKRAYEIYEEYTKLHGNSYIHDKWEELIKKGLLKERNKKQEKSINRCKEFCNNINDYSNGYTIVFTI